MKDDGTKIWAKGKKRRVHLEVSVQEVQTPREEEHLSSAYDWKKKKSPFVSSIPGPTYEKQSREYAQQK